VTKRKAKRKAKRTANRKDGATLAIDQGWLPWVATSS
jgi:hypothetical protein